MSRIGLVVATDGKLWNGEKEYGKHFIGKFQQYDEKPNYDLFYAVTNQLPKIEDFHNYSGFVISGSHFSCNDPHPWITNLINFVLAVHEYNKSQENKTVNLFGICFGHQLIAKAFGGRVEVTKHKKKFIFDCEQVEITEEVYRKQWFQQIFGDRKSFNIVELHGDEVAMLPYNATRVGQSKSCLNEACLYDDGHIFTLQGHPEDLIDDVRDVKGPYLMKAKCITRMKMVVKFLTH